MPTARATPTPAPVAEAPKPTPTPTPVRGNRSVSRIPKSSSYRAKWGAPKLVATLVATRMDFRPTFADALKRRSRKPLIPRTRAEATEV